MRNLVPYSYPSPRDPRLRPHILEVQPGKNPQEIPMKKALWTVALTFGVFASLADWASAQG